MRCGLALTLSLAWTMPCAAQSVPAVLDDTAAPGPLSRGAFHLTMERLWGQGDEFRWLAHYGGEFDPVDYRRGRVTLLADVENVLGQDLQRFEPSQANYTLEASGSLRTHGAEWAGLVHHVSRHLVDRAKNFQINWNGLGGRYRRTSTGERWRGGVVADAWVNVDRNFVDYDGEATADLQLWRRRDGRATYGFRGWARYVWLDPEVAGRSDQIGGRGEFTMRIQGRIAADLIVFAERRVDAWPFDRTPRSWGGVGLRILSSTATVP